MKCYSCAQEGRAMDAIAVCTVCGMALCMEHSHERDVPMVQRSSGWVGQMTMHVLCERCSKLALTA